MNVRKKRILVDDIVWTRYEYEHSHTIWQRDCPHCDFGLLKNPARFCNKCQGSGYLVATESPEQKESSAA